LFDNNVHVSGLITSKPAHLTILQADYDNTVTITDDVMDHVRGMSDKVTVFESPELKVKIKRKSIRAGAGDGKRNAIKDDKLFEYVLSNKHKEPLTVLTDHDIASAIDASALRDIDFASFFLPILHSLCLSDSFTKDDLKRWTQKSDKKAERVVNEALCNKNHSRDKIRCGYAIEFIRQTLKRKVIDSRSGDVTVNVDKVDKRWAYPTAANGWTALNNGRELREYIEHATSKDRKTANTQNERRRLFRISGRMGVGKTNAVLEYAANQLRQGHVSNVTYLAPRQILAQKTADNVKTMKPVKYDRASFDVLLYHQNSHDKIEWLERHINNNELAMSVGNMFIDWNRQKGNGEEGGVINMANDLMVMDEVTSRIQQCRLVFFLEARPTDEMVTAYTDMWKWPMTLTQYLDQPDVKLALKLPKSIVGKTEKQMDDMKTWKTWMAKKRYTLKIDDVMIKYDPVSNRAAIQMDPIDIVVAPDLAYGPVFDHIVEFQDHSALYSKLIHSLIVEKKKVVVYVSSAVTGARVVKMIAAITGTKGMDTIPDMALITADTLRFVDNKDAAIAKCIDETRGLVFSNAMGAGPSYEKENAFDEAYLIVDIYVLFVQFNIS
jgi:hypothetical protein